MPRQRPSPRRAAARRAYRAVACGPVVRPLNTTNPTVRHRVFPSGPRSPMRPGRAGTSSHADAIRCQRAALVDSTKRSAATVGAQCGPVPSVASGSGAPDAMSPAADANSRIRPSRRSSNPVALVRRLSSRTPRPPARSSGIGVAERVSMMTSISRSRSRADPAAAASTSATEVVVATGSGGAKPMGPGNSPRMTCPTRRGRITVSSSICRSSPTASRRCTGRCGGVPGVASRVRPTGDPSTSRSSSSR